MAGATDPSLPKAFVNPADLDRQGIEPWWVPVAAFLVYFAIRLLRGIPTDAIDFIFGLALSGLMAVLFLSVDRWYARRR